MASNGPDLSAAHWRKSSYSNGTGGDCIEVAERFPGAATWRKSSHSNGDGGSCVEVADGLTGIVPVRDSKTAPHGPAIVVPANAWARFVTAVQYGDLTS
ncbi:DUF397 domain-containing protein [Streptomyces sp. ISL-98]|uniref:DUF397 domain-containing protein n=1 Tax=Streptomyces sp. ISL-98 TaxID=2819192 RepID=UPI001BEA1C3E|nr:DUF397 domain-containing protein [Streptomyces sp. ISL-98]MBT2506085.1 DUF397 domain-containing protein [Streptomyces sp. ISL-98]